ncbi:MAG: PQQ-like beta-propeller repeat protein [Planctomycetota bacterium]|nr:PQQ-like beta-propeller repeat protein [Planctomycetota bacterium]
MRTSIPLLLGVLIFVAVETPAADPSAPGLLGAPGFEPSPQQPFGWRGDGSGRFPGATPPLEWSLKKNVRWSTVVGRSYSSPIVTAKLVFVTSEPNLLVCLDRADGKVIWKVEMKPTDVADEKGRKMAAGYEVAPAGAGMTAATPLTDGKNVYAVFANGIVRAVGLDGEPQWTTFIDAEQNTGYGRSSSPILAAGKLIVHMTNLYAFDPATGKQLWVNAKTKSRYGTPTGFTLGANNLIVTPAGDVVRVDDGTSVAASIGNTLHSSPVAADGVVYFCEKDVSAVRLAAAFKDEELWSGEIEGELFGSPLLHDGVLFTANAQGELIAFNTAAKGSTDPLIAPRSLLGEVKDKTGKPIAYASLALAGKHLFLNTTIGDIIVLEATREAKPVARNSLRDGTGSAPVFSGKEMFLRDGDKLFCIGE